MLSSGATLNNHSRQWDIHQDTNVFHTPTCLQGCQRAPINVTRVTQVAVTLPNPTNKHVGMFIKKGRRKEGRGERERRRRMLLISVASHVDESEMWNQTCESEEREHDETRFRLLTLCGCDWECWSSPWHISNLCGYGMPGLKAAGGFSSHTAETMATEGSCYTLWTVNCELTGALLPHSRTMCSVLSGWWPGCSPAAAPPPSGSSSIGKSQNQVG